MEVASSFLGRPAQHQEGEGHGEEGVWDSWEDLGGIRNARHRPELCPDMQQGNDSCTSADA